MTATPKQTGFSLPAVIVTILLLCIVGAVGFYVYKNSQNDKTAKNSESKSLKQQNGGSDNEPETPAPESENESQNQDEYLTVKEWGVRFPLPEGLIGDVTYETRPTGEDFAAWFEIGSIADMPGSRCKLSDPEWKGVGVFLRRTTQPISEAAAAYSRFANKKLGEYFYSGGRERYSEECVVDQAYFQFVEDSRFPMIHSMVELEASP